MKKKKEDEIVSSGLLGELYTQLLFPPRKRSRRWIRPEGSEMWKTIQLAERMHWDVPLLRLCYQVEYGR